MQAGTLTKAPLKLTTGTALTAAEDGAMEYDSSHLYFTIGSTRYQLDQQSGGGGGMTWNNVTATTQAMAVNNGYIANHATLLVTLTLPATAAIGDVIEIQGSGIGGWSIAQNAGQQILIGSLISTVGVTGSVSSYIRTNAIRLICTVANTTFVADSASSLTVV